MDNKIQLDNNFGIFTATALEQLDDAGVVNVIGNQVHYYDIDSNSYLFCGTKDNINLTVCRVLDSVDEEYLEGIVDTDSFVFSDVREVA